MTKQDKLKHIRSYCKERNATFKRSSHYIINALAWLIVDRTTGETLARSLTIDDSYDRIINGYNLF